MTRANLTGLSGAAAALLTAMVWASPAQAGVILVDFEDVEPQKLLTRGGQEPFETNGVTIIVPLNPGRGASLASIIELEDAGNSLRITRSAEFFFPTDTRGLSFRFTAGAKVAFDSGVPATTFDLFGIAALGLPIAFENLVITAEIDPEGPLDGVASIVAVTGAFSHIQIGTFAFRETTLVDDLVVALHVPEPATGLYGVSLLGIAICMFGRVCRRSRA